MQESGSPFPIGSEGGPFHLFLEAQLGIFADSIWFYNWRSTKWGKKQHGALQESGSQGPIGPAWVISILLPARWIQIAACVFPLYFWIAAIWIHLAGSDF